MKKTTGTRKTIKKLTSRAILAFENEFYLETSWIISMIIETRLRSILALVDGRDPGAGYGLDRCLKRVKYHIGKGDLPVLSGEIGLPLADAIRMWKNQRNRILKDMNDKHVTVQRVAGLAQEGIVLMQDTNSSWKKFKTAWAGLTEPASARQDPTPEDHEKV
jgi:hypothetical protein